MIYLYQVKGSKENKRTECKPSKVSFSPEHKISFHLPLIHSIISISLEKSMKIPKQIVTINRECLRGGKEHLLPGLKAVPDTD